MAESLNFSFQSILPQHGFVLGIDVTQVQDCALALAELHEVHTNQPLQPVHVPLDATPFLPCVTTADKTKQRETTLVGQGANHVIFRV